MDINDQVNIFTTYDAKYDITTIFEENYNGNHLTVTVKGFYYGTPNDRDTKEFYNKLVAEIDLV